MYEESKEEFEKLRSKNQEVAEKEYVDFVNKLKYKIIKNSNSSNNEYNEKVDILDKIGINCHKDIFYLFLIYLVMIIFGLFMLIGKPENIPLFLAGMVFFAAGFQLAVSETGTGFGIIFLFSHGGTGFAIMNYSLINGRFSTDLLSDLSGNLKIYIIFIILITIVAFLCTVIYNLSTLYRKNIYNKVILLLLYLVVVLLVGFLPIINF